MKEFEINSKADITAFISYMTNELSVSFHPDESFSNIINIKTDEPTFTQEEADYFDGIMSRCFEWCRENEEDIYEIGLDVIVSQLNGYS